MKEITVEATVSNLDQVLDFINEELDTAGCSMKNQMQIDIAVEELFVNIAHYAYAPETGDATVSVDFIGEPSVCEITFTDRGIPYDPLAKEDPDITLSAEQRAIGGLGIYMVKQSMDDIRYEYRDGHNVLTICKAI